MIKYIATAAIAALLAGCASEPHGFSEKERAALATRESTATHELNGNLRK